jgi:hypothetical protein
MKRLLTCILLCGAAALHAAGDETTFSKSLRADELASAGLGKLTPAELAKLDALVRDYRSGALEVARRAAAEAESRAAKAEAKAQAADAGVARKPDESLLSKAKVLLTPGTKVEYTTVESHLAGEFRGWDAHTVFNLENGQRWQATGGDSYVGPAIAAPAVKIVPGVLGSFWMTIEGVRQRVKVKPLGGGS